jgi:hypothetical protein
LSVKPSPTKKKELDIGDWIVVFFLLAIGVYLIRAGILAGWDILTIGLGVAFSGGAILGTPPLRVFVKVAINRVSGKQVFQVEQSHISGSNVIGVARDVHIHEAPQVVAPPTVTQPVIVETEEEWEVDDEFDLEPDGYRSIPVDLEEGERLVGYVHADENVSCYVLGQLSLRSFEDGENFNPYWENENVTRTKVSFIAEGARTYYFVVYRDKNEEDEVSVSVMLRIENA